MRPRAVTWLLSAAFAAAAIHPLESRAVDRDLGSFDAWSAHTFVDGNATVCSMWSQPRSAKGNYTRRGEVFAFVTHRPREKRRDELSFEIGYTFKPGAPLVVTIDKRRFELITNGSTAWTDKPEASATMVRLMRAGRTMVVEGISSRGTRTLDTYSLKGFTAAHNAIDKACKRR